MNYRTYERKMTADRLPSTGPYLVEVIVNVPIRRSFAKQHKPPADDEYTDKKTHQLSAGDAHYQTFHYHLPPELVGKVEAGHLVWAPFGSQEVQGIIVQATASAPVDTKPIARLARPHPVLTPTQLEMAFWIADYYVAPLSQAVKLFLPPGLLQKKGEQPKVRAKREEQIELLIQPTEIREHLFGLGRPTKQVLVLETLLASPSHALPLAALQNTCNLRSSSTVSNLKEKRLIRLTDGVVSLAQSAMATEEAILGLRGARKYEAVLQALGQAASAMWKTDLYAQVDTDLQSLRQLQQAGLIRIDERTRYRDPLAGRAYATTYPPRLTEQQQQVWHTLATALFPPTSTDIRPGGFLLHGVTGSGKTEIYLRAIAETLARKQQAIVLVPEIALTPQTIARFAGRFPGQVSVIHSELPPGERYDVWRRVRDGEINVVVGPRSALFAPLPRLGLVIIDEEHESSYKQNAEEWGSYTVFYDARTLARRLAHGRGLILGSATPSLETYHESQQGILTLLEMPKRHTPLAHDGSSRAFDHNPTTTAVYALLPPVEVVDMRQELRAGNRSIFSRSLQSELHATLDAGQQAILFLNRRGSHTFVLCRDCGYVAECTRCETPLTFHEQLQQLICHRCNARAPIPSICPSCTGRRIKYFGSGTQRVEDLVRQIAPRARLLRWDRDATKRKGSHEQILEQFANYKADILVGTQMIAKGLDLPLVTLVGVISADVGLYLPDFRAPERTFQLLTQVAGRAGRSNRGGRVIFQSYSPQHYALQAATQHDYHAFYEREMAFRQEQKYPPLGRLARLIFWHKKLETVEEQTQQMARSLRHRAQQMGLWGDDVDLLGPLPAPFARFRGFYRWQIIIRAADPSTFLQGIDIPFGWRVDIDPVSML